MVKALVAGLRVMGNKLDDAFRLAGPAALRMADFKAGPSFTPSPVMATISPLAFNA